MTLIISISIAAFLYILFTLWYRGNTKPLTKEEVEEFIGAMKKNRGIEEETKQLKAFREIAAKDDGKEFLMVNLMKFKDNDPGSEAMAAHHRYSKHIVPELIKRGSHPVLLSNVQGTFLAYPDAENWDQVGIIRYRSRRDLLKMAVALSGKNIDKDKWLSMEKTHVFPAKQVLRLGSLRITAALVLIIFCLVIGGVLF